MGDLLRAAVAGLEVPLVEAVEEVHPEGLLVEAAAVGHLRT